MRCQDERVLPASQRIKPPVKTRERYRITECASRAFLSACIRETYLRKCELSSKINLFQEGLNRGTHLPSQRGQADHQVHCGAGRRWSTPFPRHTLLRKREDGSPDVFVYRKPTHRPDRYLHFESHHPTHVNRGVVRYLHDRARGLISTQDNLQKEVDHLAQFLKQNGYKQLLAHYLKYLCLASSRSFSA